MTRAPRRRHDAGHGRPRGSRGRWHLVAVGALPSLFAAVVLLVQPSDPAVAGDPDATRLCYGAASMEKGSGCVQPTTGPTVPSLEDARADRSESYKYRCQTKYDFTDRLVCEFGDLQAERNVALVGNSHAVHWLPAIHEIGLRQGFKVTTFFSAACVVTTNEVVMRASKNCLKWGNWVRETTAKGGFDLIIQSDRAYRTPAGRGDRYDIYERGFRKHLQRWADAGRTVLVIRGTPKPAAPDVPGCLMKNRRAYDACAGTRGVHVLPDPLAQAAYSFPSERVRVADLTDYFCKTRACPAVIGGVVVFFDGSHITATYARSLVPYLEEHVVQALAVDAAARGAV